MQRYVRRRAGLSLEQGVGVREVSTTGMGTSCGSILQTDPLPPVGAHTAAWQNPGLLHSSKAGLQLGSTLALGS